MHIKTVSVKFLYKLIWVVKVLLYFDHNIINNLGLIKFKYIINFYIFNLFIVKNVHSMKYLNIFLYLFKYSFI